MIDDYFKKLGLTSYIQNMLNNDLVEKQHNNSIKQYNLKSNDKEIPIYIITEIEEYHSKDHPVPMPE